MKPRFTLTKLTNFISKIESTYNIDVDDAYHIDTYFIFGGTTEASEDEHEIVAVMLPEQSAILFTDAPHTAVCELYNIELNEEGRDIIWTIVRLQEFVC